MLFCCYLICTATVGFVALGVIATVRLSPVSILSPTLRDSDNDLAEVQVRAT